MEEIMARGPNFIYTREFIQQQYGEAMWDRLLEKLPDDVSEIWNRQILVTAIYPFSVFKTLIKELYPITEEALQMLANLTYDSGESLIPRTLQTNANDCLGEVISRGKYIITSDIVESTIIL